MSRVLPSSETADGPVVFVRVGRLKFYDTRRDDEGPVGGGSFNDSNTGSEVENFRPFRGTLNGYAEVPRTSGGFNPRRVGVQPNDEGEMPGVLLVMVALSEAGHGQVVVGWYRNATLFDESYDRPGRLQGLHNFTAREDSATLLPISRREWRAHKGAGGFGQANVFYLRDARGRPRPAPWAEEILGRIRRYDGPSLLDEENLREPPAGRKTGWNRTAARGTRLTAAENRAVEMAAMERATAFFSTRGYRVTDVHNTESFDLLCERTGEDDVRVEVKGTTGAGEAVTVTANEVESARTRRTALFVVSGLELQRGTRPIAVGGEDLCVLPWRPGDSDLRVTQYQCRVPRNPTI